MIRHGLAILRWMSTRKEMAEFLQTRRARLQPEDVGIRPHPGPRRVPGLRREELAQLAGVSVDYYVRLEQGRSGNVSASVLEAVARALRLDDVERAHLFDLAKPKRTVRRSPRPQRVRPELNRLLDSLDHLPAFILGRRMDVLACNRLARALICDFDAVPREERNMARYMFLDEEARERYVDWESCARDTVGILRMDAGRHACDPQLNALVGELSVRSEEFSRWWAEHDVRERTHGTKRYRHPLVGDVTVEYETLRLADDSDQSLVIYTAEPGSPSETALQLLAGIAGGDRAGPVEAAAERRS